MTYVDWQEKYKIEKPYQLFSALSEIDSGLRTTNLVFRDGPPEIMHDIRGLSIDTFTLAKQGFQFCQHNLVPGTVESTSTIETQYLPEMEALLRQEVDGVDQVYFFDWRVYSTSGRAGSGIH